MKLALPKQLLGVLRRSGESFMDVPIVELAGDHRLLIENHSGIADYDSEQVSVKVRYGELCVCGFGMEITRMTKDQLVISGIINSVMIQRKGEI